MLCELKSYGKLAQLYTVAYAINNIFCVDGQLTELHIYARLNNNFIPSLWLLLQMKSS